MYKAKICTFPYSLGVKAKMLIELWMWGGLLGFFFVWGFLVGFWGFVCLFSSDSDSTVIFLLGLLTGFCP